VVVAIIRPIMPGSGWSGGVEPQHRYNSNTGQQHLPAASSFVGVDMNQLCLSLKGRQFCAKYIKKFITVNKSRRQINIQWKEGFLVT
jgi:hypothetical protein